jgi:hypothetical protein
VKQFDADLRRFCARRIVRGTILIALLIAVISIAIPTVRGHAPAPTTTKQIQVGITPDGQPIYSTFGPTVRDTRIKVGHDLEDALKGLSILMILIGAMLGASFVGADFHLGSLTSQLLFEPQRWRVHLAKAAAVAVGCAAFAVGLCLAVAVMMYIGSELHGVVQGLDTEWLRHRGINVSRAAAIGAAAAVMAYSITVVTRRTSAAIVAFFVQFPFVAAFDGRSGVFAVIARYAPLQGLLALAVDPRASGGSDNPVHTNAGAIMFTLAWIVILVGGSGLSFSRAEVR